MFKQYDPIELIENINPVCKAGMQGVILEVLAPNMFEVEFLDDKGYNIQYNEQATFTVSSKQLKRLRPIDE